MSVSTSCYDTQDSNPRGVIRLLPSGWSRPVSQGSLRMPDAVVTSNDKGPGIMSVVSELGILKMCHL